MTKTRSIRNIEEKIKDIDGDELRLKVLETAKSFKTSWIDLGQTLYTVWKDKSYKAWGYGKFDIFTKKEIGIRKETAMKLLRSYYFLEKEEPLYLKEDHNEGAGPASVPTYESVNLLRLANNKKGIDRADYAHIKEKVLKNGTDAHELKRDLTALIKEREELLPEEARRKKKGALIRRLLGLLKSLKTEIKISKMLPARIAKDVDRLIDMVESEIPPK